MLWLILFPVLFTLIAWNSYSEKQEYFSFIGSALVVMAVGAIVATVIGFCLPKTQITTKTIELAALLQPADCACAKRIFIMPLTIGGDDYISFRFKTTPPSKITAQPLKDFEQSGLKTNRAYLVKSKLHFKKPWYYFLAINFSPNIRPKLCLPEGGWAQ